MIFIYLYTLYVILKPPTNSHFILDYSQRSETSSHSAPANYAATPEERDTGSAHSSPAATAFTIAFETEANTPRKKLGIRDSISKFAPPSKIVDAESRVTFQKAAKTEPSPKKAVGVR